MKIEQILYLNDISKTHSISQSAQRLFISQQALSISLAKLEEEFGATFLQRTNHGVTLTKEGTLFLEKGLDILNLYFELKNKLHSAALSTPQFTPPSGSLRIFSHTRILEPVLVDLLERYTEMYPDVKITLYEKENIDIINEISCAHGDLGIIFSPDFLTDETISLYKIPQNISMEELFSDAMMFCCSNHHPLAKKKTLYASDLYSFPAVLFDTNKYVQQDKNTDTASQSIEKNRYYSNNTAFHKAMVRYNLAFSVITAFEFRKLYSRHKDLLIIPIIDIPKSIINLVTNKAQPLTLEAQLFIELLRNFNFYGS